jgi:SapC
MTDSKQNQNGNMFLYGQPELLTLEDHGALGLTPSDTPYALASGVRAVPVTVAEFASAQRHYPIVFTNIDAPYPVAVVGLLEDDNLFMENGVWDPACYVPAYLRCHPFAFAAEQEGRIAVVVDRAAPTVTKDAKYPFFVDGKLAPETESMMHFCAKYEAERQRTVDFCRALKDLGVLAAQRAAHTPEGGGEEQVLANYVSVDAQKLAELEAGSVVELHKSGRLAAAYLQLYSMENWQPLMMRRDQRLKSAA